MNQSSEYFVSCVISQNINCFFLLFSDPANIQLFNGQFPGTIFFYFLDLYSPISWTCILLFPGSMISYFLDQYSLISWTYILLFPGPIFFYFPDQWSPISWTYILLFPGPMISYFLDQYSPISWTYIFFYKTHSLLFLEINFSKIFRILNL